MTDRAACWPAVLAAIPYTTFPVIELGPLTLRTFGLMVALGVVLGAWIAAVHAEQYGMTRDDTYRLGTRMVIAGVIGARLTWVATHCDQIEHPIDVIAVWEGGLQFSGGFIAAIVVGLPIFRGGTGCSAGAARRLRAGLPLGLAFGRIGCYAVGEHFGRRVRLLPRHPVRRAVDVPREPSLRETTLGPARAFHRDRR